MTSYFCKKCGTNKHIKFDVEVIPMEESKPYGDVHSIRVNAICARCGDWISVDVTRDMEDFFDYFGENRDEGTLMLDRDCLCEMCANSCNEARMISIGQSAYDVCERWKEGGDD